MSAFRPHRLPTFTAACLAALALVAAASPAAAEPHRGIRFRVPYAVELPDGTLVRPGTITIRESREISPVAAIHRVDVGGQTSLMVIGRTKATEIEGIEEPFVLFHRMPSGALRLIGYVWSDGKNARAYLLVDGHAADRALARRPSAIRGEGEVLLAASLDGR